MNLYAVLLQKKHYQIKVFQAGESPNIAAGFAERIHKLPVASVELIEKKRKK